jgi:hypothetical protein
VPRYFFNVVDGVSKNLMGDSDGIVLSDLSRARKEAVGWARDFTRHNFGESIRSWKVIVTNDTGDVVLTVPLAEARPAKLIRVWLELGRHISNFDSRFGSHVLVLLLAVAIVAVIVQAGLKTATVKETGGGYELASASTESPVLAVRFAPNASLVEITKFLDAYKASLFEGPGPGSFYKLRIPSTSVPQGDIKALIGRISQEKVIDLVAAMP